MIALSCGLIWTVTDDWPAGIMTLDSLRSSLLSLDDASDTLSPLVVSPFRVTVRVAAPSPPDSDTLEVSTLNVRSIPNLATAASAAPSAPVAALVIRASMMLASTTAPLNP